MNMTGMREKLLHALTLAQSQHSMLNNESFDISRFNEIEDDREAAIAGFLELKNEQIDEEIKILLEALVKLQESNMKALLEKNSELKKKVHESVRKSIALKNYLSNK